MLSLIWLILGALGTALRPPRELALENLALRHQLEVALRHNPRPRLGPADRAVWVWLARVWPGGWRKQLRIVRPETVIRWHRQGWRLFWTWRSRGRLGRPRIPAEVRDLISLMSRENRLWGAERIRGELLKLGIRVSNRSIRRYRWRPGSREGSQRWRTFLVNEMKGIWAADLFVVQTAGMKALYGLFFIAHDRREVVQVNVTSSPTAAWIWQQLINATSWDRGPSFLIHDRDASFGADFGARLGAVGVTDVRTPPRSPRANAIAERAVRTFREECLDHVIIINERHLRSVMSEFIDYYNRERPHRSLGLEEPLPRERSHVGDVTATPVLGGLHHAYERAA
ncbi:MAG: integrase core domain-containing protein [Candidatus Dormibacteria bacterium]